MNFKKTLFITEQIFFIVDHIFNCSFVIEDHLRLFCCLFFANLVVFDQNFCIELRICISLKI
jgi:hypothetical protein